MCHLDCRSYISFDILRRVFIDYFNYEVLYVMNITDIDDKIIRRARRKYLFGEYLGKHKDHSDLVTDLSAAIEVRPLKEWDIFLFKCISGFSWESDDRGGSR